MTPSHSLPDADLNLPEMKTKSPSCPAGGVHMYEFEHRIKSPSVPRHCRDDAEVKTWHLSPAIPGPMGTGLTNDWCITDHLTDDRKVIHYHIIVCNIKKYLY